MKVREATASDVEAIRTVHAASIRELGTAAYDAEQVAAWASGVETATYADIDSADVSFVVAEDEGTLLGFGSLSFSPADDYGAAVDAEVTGVYIHPSAARRGVGSLLLAELERRARGRGVGTLGLMSSLNAVPFYETHGYERVEEHDHEFSAHLSTGVEGTVLEMVKEL
jgi:putative acetyltransferase